MGKENEIVLFETEDAKVRLTVPIQEDTVWLTQAQMTELFDTSKQNVSLHINNCFKEGELDKDSVVKDFLTTASDGKNYKTKYYNLDVIISVGYRVKSRRGIEFRRWANKVLKDYIIKGYAINDKRLEALQKTVEIQAKMLATAIEGDSDEVLKAVNLYTQALTLLDQYDHQSLEKPEGNQPIYRITYADCRAMVDRMEDSFRSDLFGVEKEPGKIEGILAAVYQDVFGGEVYPSLEEKAGISKQK